MTGRCGAGSLFFPFALDPDWVTRLARVLDGYGGRPATAEPHDEPCPRLRDVRAALERIAVADGRLRLAHWRLLYQKQYMFGFRIALAADEMDQWIVHVLIDPVSERPCALPADPGWVAFPPLVVTAGAGMSSRPGTDGGTGTAHTTAAGAGVADHYAVRRLYRRARALLPRVVGPRWRAFCTRLDDRRRDERERIDGYYRALLAQRDEEKERLRWAEQRLWAWRALWGGLRPADRHGGGDGPAGTAVASDGGAVVPVGAGPVPPNGRGHAPDNEGDLEDEWRRRLEELELRYRPRAEAELIYGAVVMVPCLEVHWRLAHPRRRDVIICYDFVRGDWLDWRCEACERPLGKTAGEPPPRVLPDGLLVCPDCCATCAGCGKAFLPGDGGGSCHLCNAPLCAACFRPCSLDAMASEVWGLSSTGVRQIGEIASGTLRAPCPRCREEWCSICLAFAHGFAGGGLTAAPRAVAQRSLTA